MKTYLERNWNNEYLNCLNVTANNTYIWARESGDVDEKTADSAILTAAIPTNKLEDIFLFSSRRYIWCSLEYTRANSFADLTAALLFDLKNE